MKYATVCSGIEAPSVAWHPLGWEPVWFSEIAKFPSAVLKNHYPNVPNLGDMEKIHENETFKKSIGSIDLICGGTPCQSFSVAGLRGGMGDPRGNLALIFLTIVNRIRPRWVVWENVPGVLSSNKGRDFGSFVGWLGQLGYGWAYRILDAQYFGVPQRRRRVFVIGYFGDWRPPAAVLFEFNSLRGNNPPRRETGQEFAANVAPSLTASGQGVQRTGETRGQDTVIAFGGRTSGCIETACALNAHGSGRYDFESETFISAVAPILTFGGKSAGSVTQQDAENGALIFQSKASSTNSMNPSTVSPTLDLCKSNGLTIYDFAQITSKENRSNPKSGDPAHCISANSNPTLVSKSGVRRLTPVECERLQGFPDNYTKINSQTKDGPRYKAIGNSMAVPVMRWIGKRINQVENILNQKP